MYFRFCVERQLPVASVLYMHVSPTIARIDGCPMLVTARSLFVPLKCQNKRIGRPRQQTLYTCPYITSHHITERRPLISGEPTQYGLALAANWLVVKRESRNAALRKICHRNWSLFVILHDKISHRGTTYFRFIYSCANNALGRNETSGEREKK